MEWLYPKRRKQGWTGQAMSSFSAPSLHFLMIFGIVISCLWFSQSSDYKTQLYHTAINIHLFLLLSPILLVFIIISYSSSRRLSFRLSTQSEQDSLQRAAGSSVSLEHSRLAASASVPIFISVKLVWPPPLKLRLIAINRILVHRGNTFRTLFLSFFLSCFSAHVLIFSM